MGDEIQATLTTLAIVILGWLLGLLSPIIVDTVKKPYREAEVRSGILTELGDLRLRMALLVHLLGTGLGIIDRSKLEWLLGILDTYNGHMDADSMRETLKKLLSLDENTLTAVLERDSSNHCGGKGVKKYRVPYLDSKIGELGIFCEQSRAAILNVRAHLELFNEEVDEARLYHRMTFELADSEVNHPIICQNVRNCYQHLVDGALTIIESIESIMPTRRTGSS